MKPHQTQLKHVRQGESCRIHGKPSEMNKKRLVRSIRLLWRQTVKTNKAKAAVENSSSIWTYWAGGRAVSGDKTQLHTHYLASPHPSTCLSVREGETALPP